MFVAVTGGRQTGNRVVLAVLLSSFRRVSWEVNTWHWSMAGSGMKIKVEDWAGML